jgi:hypothetical protein
LFLARMPVPLSLVLPMMTISSQRLNFCLFRKGWRISRTAGLTGCRRARA